MARAGNQRKLDRQWPGLGKRPRLDSQGRRRLGRQGVLTVSCGWLLAISSDPATSAGSHRYGWQSVTSHLQAIPVQAGFLPAETRDNPPPRQSALRHFLTLFASGVSKRPSYTCENFRPPLACKPTNAGHLLRPDESVGNT